METDLIHIPGRGGGGNLLVKPSNTHQGCTALAVDIGWLVIAVINNVSVHQKCHYPWI